MRPRGSARGEGKIGCVFWSLMGLIFVMIAIKAVPVKLASLKLEDHMKELAMSPRARVAGKDFFEREIYNKAHELKLDIPRKQIRAKKYPERVVMDVEFTVPIDILTFTYDWNIVIHVDRDVFWI